MLEFLGPEWEADLVLLERLQMIQDNPIFHV